MALQVAKRNSPDDGPVIIAGKKHAWAIFSWEAADAYVPTTHSTTKPFNNGTAVGGETKPLAGKNPIDLWGIRYIDEILWEGAGGSDADIPTGSVKPVWVRNGQYIKLIPVGNTGTGGTLTAVAEVELTAVAGNLESLVLYGEIIGD
jgi:hypothetical protein